MSAPSGDIACDGNTLDLLEFLGLPLDFSSAVLAADEASHLCQPPPSASQTLGATGTPACEPSAAQPCIGTLSSDLFSRAYSITAHGMRPPALDVRLCGEGRGWGLFARANFAANDVLFVETPMYCVAEPETSNMHCDNCMRSFCRPPPQLPHAQLWATDAHVTCSRGDDSCSAVYCNAFCR